MKRIVDLTLPIEEHWRYGIHFDHPISHEKGDPWQATTYNLDSHWFTHIDSPRHHIATGEDLDAYPLEDWCIGRALVLDFSWVEDNTPITGEMLEEAAKGYEEHFDYLLIRTDRANKVSWKSYEYWDDSPYVTKDGGEWIKRYNPKVVGFDFAQDYDIRNMRFVEDMHEIKEPVHDVVLAEGGILMIEYMTNFWNIGAPVCDIIALPLKIPHTDGTQIRVIALVEE